MRADILVIFALFCGLLNFKNNFNYRKYLIQNLKIKVIWPKIQGIITKPGY